MLILPHRDAKTIEDTYAFDPSILLGLIPENAQDLVCRNISRQCFNLAPMSMPVISHARYIKLHDAFALHIPSPANHILFHTPFQ